MRSEVQQALSTNVTPNILQYTGMHFMNPMGKCNSIVNRQRHKASGYNANVYKLKPGSVMCGERVWSEKGNNISLHYVTDFIELTFWQPGRLPTLDAISNWCIGDVPFVLFGCPVKHFFSFFCLTFCSYLPLASGVCPIPLNSQSSIGKR